MIEVASVHGAELVEPVKLLEESLRNGDPVSDDFAKTLREAVEAGALEVLAARAEGHVVGVAVLAYRLSISAAGPFVSIEDLYVRPEERVGAWAGRCSKPWRSAAQRAASPTWRHRSRTKKWRLSTPHSATNLNPACGCSLAPTPCSWSARQHFSLSA